MLDRVKEFAGLLRNNGVRTSTAEVLDAVRALTACGLSDPAAVRAALVSTLIKRHEDEEIFDELFTLFFFQPAKLLRALNGEAPLIEKLRAEGISEDEIERILALLADKAARLDPTARMALGLRRSDIEALLRLSGLRIDFGRLANPLQIGFFTQQILEQLRFSDARTQLGQLAGELGGSGTHAELVLKELEQNLSALRAAVRTYVKNQFEQRNVKYAEDLRRDLLVYKPFAQMSQEDLFRLRREIERLAEKLRTQASLRPRRRRRGRLDMRRTLRCALAAGGTPFRLELRHRRAEKPRLCILCDVSDSVRHVSRFMLQFVYTLQELFAKVRSFVFVSDLGEATDLFSHHKLDIAVEQALSGAVVHVYANSNYGRALRQFVDTHLEAVTSRTTVIIIGDGRNNYFPSEAWALGRIRARAKHVLWLNPEQPASWMFGDSAMRDYEPHLSRVEVVYNLDSLRRVIDGLGL